MTARKTLDTLLELAAALQDQAHRDGIGTAEFGPVVVLCSLQLAIVSARAWVARVERAPR